jgi:hypothetical protein
MAQESGWDHAEQIIFLAFESYSVCLPALDHESLKLELSLVACLQLECLTARYEICPLIRQT